MISKNKRTPTKKMQKAADNPVRPDFSKSELPVPYSRLMSLIFFSSDSLIHKVSSSDKISS
jgi:hypothetical protein